MVSEGVLMSLDSVLRTLADAYVVPASGVEPADIEDAAFDHATAFANRPFATLSLLTDPEGQPLFALSDGGTLPARAGLACAALDHSLHDISIVPDSPTATTGSARVQFSEWDVADVEFDGDSPVFELGILAAIENRSL